MVLFSKKFKELRSQGIDILVTSKDYIIGRDTIKKLIVSLGNDFSNNLYSINKELLSDLNSTLNVGKLKIIKVKEINYIFKLNNNDERHIYNVLLYISKNDSDLLVNNDLTDFVFSPNGDVSINDKIVIQTKIDVYV